MYISKGIGTRILSIRFGMEKQWNGWNGNIKTMVTVSYFELAEI
jgi:hypothetical protein